MHPLLNIAVSAARRAGDGIARQANRLDRLTVTTKDRNEFVTEADEMAEREIIDTVRRAYPHHAFLAEEGGASGEHETCWIIDPLDGTTNFIHGIPHFAVSIAVQTRGRLEHAVIYDPMRQEMFTASRGAGAQLDGKRMRVTGCRHLADALIGTGLPYGDLQHMDAYFAMLKDIAGQTRGVRRAGAAALDLAYVAAGRLDGFWEIGLKPWDMAAGLLLIQEAGGVTGNLSGGPESLHSGNVVAGNPNMFKALVRQIRPHLSAELK